MTRRPTAARLTVALGLATLAAACGGGSTSAPTSTGGGGGGSRTSHNAGQDCLRCHRDFGVAGTVYRADGSAYPGATIRLTTAANGGGSAVLSLTSDGAGNFYASRSVGFGAGLYADVIGTTGATSAKTATVPSGACNSCHDTQNRIRAN